MATEHHCTSNNTGSLYTEACTYEQTAGHNEYMRSLVGSPAVTAAEWLLRALQTSLCGSGELRQTPEPVVSPGVGGNS